MHQKRSINFKMAFSLNHTIKKREKNCVYNYSYFQNTCLSKQKNNFCLRCLCTF